MTDLESLSREAEFFETDEWAADGIFDVELLTPFVIDAGAGRGVLARSAERRGYSVLQIDKIDWAQHGLECYESKHGKQLLDFLKMEIRVVNGEMDFTVIMNPPFSMAVEFVEHALNSGARKVLCFQRLAWRETDERKDFWDKHPPNRVYVCGSRATCWRGDLIDKRSKDMSSSPTAHAWFVWERGQPLNGLGAIHKVKSLKMGDFLK